MSVLPSAAPSLFMANPQPCPPVLTAEYVMVHLGALIRKKIRESRPRATSADTEDILQDILLRMLTPSPTLGTTYLQRYDPVRYSASAYVGAVVANHLRELHRKERTQKRAAETVSLDAELAVTSHRRVARSSTGSGLPATLANYLPDAAHGPAVEEARLMRQRLMQVLYKDRYRVIESRSPAGVPRSVSRIAYSILIEGKTPVEVAADLDWPVYMVRRRLRALRADPDLQAFRASA